MIILVIIIGWILSMLVTPIWIWVLYGVFIVGEVIRITLSVLETTLD